MKGYEGDDWFGVFAPAGTPLAIRERMAAALARPDARERLGNLGAEPAATTPQQFESMVRNYLVMARKLGDAIGIKPQ